MSDDSKELRLEVRINASPETVFGLLTDPARMKMWLAEIVEADARPGGIFRISGPLGTSIEGRYLELVPNRKVVFTWGGVEGVRPGQSIVEFLLERDGEGTLVQLRHYGLPPRALEPHRLGWVVTEDNAHLRRTPVEVIRQNDVLLASGLRPNKRVVALGAQLLDDNKVIRIVQGRLTN